MFEKIKKLLSRHEGLELEFKECTCRISETVYETVCAFLNTKGGDILLGVKDSGEMLELTKNMFLKLSRTFAIV
jgi:ATP-dependent DNA helicase RecG